MDKSVSQLITDTKNFLSLKKFDEALKSLNLIIIKDPNNISALSTIGDIYVFKKKYDDAIKIFDDIIKLNPKLSLIYNNKGYCLLNKMSFEEAIINFKKAIQHNQNYPEAYNNCGLALNKIGKKVEALEYFSKAIQIKNDYVQAYNNLTIIYLELNSINDALKTCTKSIEIYSKNIEAYNSLGLIYKRKNEIEKSLDSFSKALKINSNYLPSLINIAKIYTELKDYDKADEYFNKSLKIDPNNVNALSSFINLKLETCNWENLDKLKLNLLDLCENNNNKILQPYYSLLLSDNINFQKAIAEKYVNKFFQIKNETFIHNNNKRIRLGYFSSDFKNHAVITLIKDVFKNHDKNKFDLFGFNLSRIYQKNLIDNVTISNFKEFFDCGYKSDLEIQNLIKEHKIDISIDLNGHTKDNRFEIFKKRCSPIQINYLGYPGTSGSSKFDYIIADKILIPDHLQNHYSEKIIYLPDTYQPNCFENFKLKKNLNKESFSLPEDKFIFCCFNNLIKFNKDILDLWSKILSLSKNSIIWILCSKMSIQRKNIIKEFEKRDIHESRIFFSEKTVYDKHLERFKLADLFLDTYPYGGHTTAIEALAAELPILTRIGETFQSRVSASLLESIGLAELITHDKDDYVKLAVELSKNIEKTFQLKKWIHDQKKKSNIFNNKIYTQNLEKAYLKAFDTFLNKKKISNINLD